MLAKASRITTTAEYRSVFQAAPAAHSKLLSVRHAAGDDPAKFGIVVGSKVSASAVRRNLVKRRIRAALRALDAPGLTGDWVIVAKAPAAATDYETLRGDLAKLMEQL